MIMMPGGLRIATVMPLQRQPPGQNPTHSWTLRRALRRHGDDIRDQTRLGLDEMFSVCGVGCMRSVVVMTC